ncbi:MAG: DUF2726 domain-containing protein [Novosphingobium sp.]
MIDKPWLLAVVLALGAACGMGVERFVANQERAKWRAYWQRRGGAPSHGSGFRNGSKVVPIEGATERSLVDAADQLRVVMAAEFNPRPLLNKAEARVFAELDRLVMARNPSWQVMAQVSVGEFIASADARAYGCINSKRVDLLLVDAHCRARHAIEYQGTGHHQGNAAARDAIKKEALRRAGIGYHEVIAGSTTPRELRQLVDKLVPGSDAGLPVARLTRQNCK